MTDASLSRTRVLLIHNFLSPYRIPLFTELAKRFELDVWILGDVSRLREWSGQAPEDAFKFRVLPNVGIGLGSRYNRILFNPTLRRELASHAFDVLICCGWDTPAVFQASRWAKQHKKPFVLWAGSTPAESTLVRSISRLPVRRLVQRADSWVAYGSRAKEYLVSLGAAADRTFCAYNTIEVDRFARESELAAGEAAALRAQLGIRAPSVVLFCGNLLPLKGLDALLHGFAKFLDGGKHAALLLVGSGEGEERYRALAEALGIGDQVVFAGYRDRADLPRFYALGDILVLPSRSEVWGLVLNEALASGVPVIASEAVGAAPDLIRVGVNGYVVPVDAPDAISDTLHEFFGPENDRAAMRSAARESIKPFTIEAMADAFERAVATALTRRRG